MKKIMIYTVIVASLMTTSSSFSQVMNWASLKKEQRHIINFNAGAEHGLAFGAGYGYHLKSSFPIILNAEYSFPSGNIIFDDFKTKIGGQIRLYEVNNFHFSARVQGVFRRYENTYARLLNFGSDLAAVGGYYKPKWFVAAEIGFDKAIVTHFKHSAAYKQNYPDAKDGWYEPPTGGNFYYGLQTGFSFGHNDIYLKGGKILTQDFRTAPLFPAYFQLGYNIRLN